MKNFRFDTTCNILQEPQEYRSMKVYLWVHRQVCFDYCCQHCTSVVNIVQCSFRATLNLHVIDVNGQTLMFMYYTLWCLYFGILTLKS